MSKQKRFYPLDSDKAQEFEETAWEMDDTLVKLTGVTLFNTGMRNITFNHMLPDWIRRKGRNVAIVIPELQPCRQGVDDAEQQNTGGVDLHQSGTGTCSACKKSRDDGTWRPKTKNGARTLPLTDGLDDLAQLLEWFFEQHDRIPFGNDGVNRRIRRITEEAGIDRDVTAHDLRHTYGTRLARMGYEPSEIRDFMGWGSTDMGERYIEFTGVRKRETFKEKWDNSTY